jgi:hypothetical protein
LFDVAFLDKLAQHAAEALFGDAQNSEEGRYGHPRVTIDEVNRTVMCAAKSNLRKDRIRLAREVTVGIEQKFDPLPKFLFPQEKWVYG